MKILEMEIVVLQDVIASKKKKNIDDFKEKKTCWELEHKEL